MKHKLLGIIITGLILVSCNLGTFGTWTNERIDKVKRSEIEILNDKLFKAIRNNDADGVNALMSPELLEREGVNTGGLLAQVNPSIKSDSYRILDEYNVRNSTSGVTNTIVSGTSNDNDYVITYQALKKEMYVCLLLPNDNSNEVLITVIYGNYNDEWKINVLQFGQYSLLKKTAPDYYKLAKLSYEKSHLIDAVNYLSLSKACQKPANDFFKYQKDKEIIDFYDKVEKEVSNKYSFPFALENISTKPKVFKISPEMIKNEGFFPLICYLSEINLNDTLALKAENEKVKQEIGKVFTGIEQDKKYVFYWAFNELPSQEKAILQLSHYAFIDKRVK